MILIVGEDSSTVAVVAEQLAVFRILRALKMVDVHQNFIVIIHKVILFLSQIARFGGLRIIVLTVLQAFQVMLTSTLVHLNHV